MWGWVGGWVGWWGEGGRLAVGEHGANSGVHVQPAVRAVACQCRPAELNKLMHMLQLRAQ